MRPHSPRIDLWIFEPDQISLEPFAVDSRAVQSMHNERLRLQRARSKSLLRLVLSRRLRLQPEEIVIGTAPGGKPFVDGCRFSISHSGPWLLVAVSDVEIGVDVETHSPSRDVMGLAGRFFIAKDAESLRVCDAADRTGAFLRQWVAKEAALKAAGVGIGEHLHKARCYFDGPTVRAVEWDAEYFSIHEFTLADGTPGAVAWQGSTATEFTWHSAAEIGLS